MEDLEKDLTDKKVKEISEKMKEFGSVAEAFDLKTQQLSEVTIKTILFFHSFGENPSSTIKAVKKEFDGNERDFALWVLGSIMGTEFGQAKAKKQTSEVKNSDSFIN